MKPNNRIFISEIDGGVLVRIGGFICLKEFALLGFLEGKEGRLG